MADLSKLRFNGTDYNVKDASAPKRKFDNTYAKTGNLPITSDDTPQSAIGKLEKALDDKINTSAKGTASGVAELDANGKVPSSQLPSYVDDVLEYSAKSSFPATGETGKIYVDTTTNKTYRWSGSAYVEISESLALGETSSTAYYGDKGKTAYTHSQTTSGNPHNVTKSDVGLGNVGNFKAVSTVASQGLSSTEQANARANIGAGTGNGTYSKPSGGIPKTDLASAVQTSLGLADSALQSHQTIKQDGVTGATVNRFGTCSTAAATAAKTVSITTGTFTLEAGARVTVKFSNANTAGTPTLNVSSTGAKNIYSKGSQITTGSNKSLLAGTVDFIYDGTQWHLIGNYIDTNTTYSSKSAASGGTDVSLCTTGEKYTWNNKGTYSKPSGGIPKTDLATAVQTSLDQIGDLATLETEDRASLAEVVDSGAKNVYNPSRIDNVPTGLTVTRESDGTTLKINGTYSGTGFAYIDVGTFITDKTGVYRLNVTSTKAMSEDFIIYTSDGHLAGDSSYNYTTNPYTSVVIKIASGQTFNNDTVKILICTKAAFNVSQKFVPHWYQSKVLYNQYIRVHTSTTLTQTGLEFIATEPGVYKFTVLAANSNSVPEIAAIYHKSASSSTYYLFTQITQQTNSTMSLTFSGIVHCSVGGGIALHSKYSSGAQNTHGLIVEKVSDLAGY